MSSLATLNQWLILNSNGDWERSHGFDIKSMSDPGVHIKIDIEDTCLEHLLIRYERLKDDLSYFKIYTSESKIIIFGGVDGIEDGILYFEKIVFPSSVSEKFFYNIYLPVFYENVEIGWIPVKGIAKDLFNIEIVDIPKLNKSKLMTLFQKLCK